jgi:ABC-type transporter MlaC component
MRMMLLAQVNLEEVFRATQENMAGGSSPHRALALALAALALLALLVLLAHRRHQQAVPRAVNHRGRLFKQIAAQLPLKKTEARQLRQLAEEQGCSSPLVLLLCPSLLGKAAAAKPPDQRKQAAGIIRKLGAGE